MNRKTLTMVSGIALILSVIFGIISCVYFFSYEKTEAKERIDLERGFRSEYIELKQTFREYGDRAGMQECQDGIDDVDREIREQQGIIDSLNFKGAVFAVFCGLGLTVAVCAYIVAYKDKEHAPQTRVIT